MTNINLRKAAAAIQVLTGEVSNLRGEITSANNTVISVYDDLDVKLANEGVKFADKHAKFINYANVLFELRESVSVANSTAGVNTILTEIAKLDILMTVAAFIAKSDPTDPAVLARRIETVKKNLTSENVIYGATEYVNICAVSKEKVATVAADLLDIKRRKRELQDNLLAVNVNTKIDLSESAEKVLKELAVI